MATTETESNSQENFIADESDIGPAGKGPVSPRERILFSMSTVRTICALIGALAQAIVLWRVFHMGH